MAKKGKKLQDAAKLIDRNAVYGAQEAIELAQKTSSVNFDATVEVAFRLGIDTRKNSQGNFRSTVYRQKEGQPFRSRVLF